MQIRDIPKLIAQLDKHRLRGGKAFKEVTSALRQEATTENVQQLQTLLNKLAHK